MQTYLSDHFVDGKKEADRCGSHSRSMPSGRAVARIVTGSGHREAPSKSSPSIRRLGLDCCAVLMMTDQLGTPREGVMSTAASIPSVRTEVYQTSRKKANFRR
jgi:hypothetical protein